MSAMPERHVIHISIDHLVFNAFSFPCLPQVGETETVEGICIGGYRRRMVNCMHRYGDISSLREDSSVREREAIRICNNTIHRRYKGGDQ